jgi:hypothetical protein
MSETDRPRQDVEGTSADDDIPSTTDRHQPSVLGGDVATRSGTASIEDVEEDEPAGGMADEGDPGR